MREPLTIETRHKANLQLGGQWWYHFCDWDFTILAPPKCGSTAIKQFIYMNELEVTSLRQYQVTGRAYFVIRNPLDRFYSLWKNKCRDKARIGDAWPIAEMSPSELMSYIESGVKNVHWTPQYKMIGKLKPTLIPLEHLNRWWRDREYGELNNFNSTDDDVIDINPKRVIDFYARDMELYTTAILDFQ